MLAAAKYFNFETIVSVLAIFVLVAFIFTIYYQFVSFLLTPSKTQKGVYSKFFPKIIKFSSIGPVSTIVKASTTEVVVTDEELHNLLELVFREIGSSNYIDIGLLQSFGLNTITVINYLENLGYIINF